MTDKYKQGQTLMVELQSLEEQGLSVRLPDICGELPPASEAVSVREEITYMRDCVFEEGELSEVSEV